MVDRGSCQGWKHKWLIRGRKGGKEVHGTGREGAFLDVLWGLQLEVPRHSLLFSLAPAPPGCFLSLENLKRFYGRKEFSILQNEWIRLRRVIVNGSPGERSKGKCRLSLVGKVLMRDGGVSSCQCGSWWDVTERNWAGNRMKGSRKSITNCALNGETQLKFVWVPQNHLVSMQMQWDKLDCLHAWIHLLSSSFNCSLKCLNLTFDAFWLTGSLWSSRLQS